MVEDLLLLAAAAGCFMFGVLFEKLRRVRPPALPAPAPSRLGGWRVASGSSITSFEVPDQALLAAFSSLSAAESVRIDREFGGDAYELRLQTDTTVDVRRGGKLIARLRPELVAELQSLLAEGDAATASWAGQFLLGLGSIEP